MLNRLRWQFTALYIIAAALLIFLIGGAAYGLLAYYFESANDLALQYKVALAYSSAGLEVPDNLKLADQRWQTRNPVVLPTPQSESEHNDDDEDENDEEDHAAPSVLATNSANHEGEETYDSELSAVFLLPVDAQGILLDNPNIYTPPLTPNLAAVESAILLGNDFRTVRLEDGSRVRLFSYRVDNGTYFQQSGSPAALQVGRSLKDQDRILTQLLIGLVILGGASVLSVGVGSWWLAGRSVKPAQQAWDRQQAFVANASHELRTPLTLLRASAEVAQRGLDASDGRYSLLGDILQETDYMSQLVDDLLLLSRLDAGRLKLVQQPISLSELLFDLNRQMGPIAERRGIRLDTLPCNSVALADPTRLRQVLLILLDNALRHTPQGGVIRMQSLPEGRYVRLVVSDSGTGIPEEHLPHIFERFYRGKEDRRQPDSGSGLGLAIARALVEAMHGQIVVTSQAGKGTQVSLRIPVLEGKDVANL